MAGLGRLRRPATDALTPPLRGITGDGVRATLATLLDIADRAGLPFDAVADAAEALAGVGLLVEEDR